MPRHTLFQRTPEEAARLRAAFFHGAVGIVNAAFTPVAALPRRPAATPTPIDQRAGQRVNILV